MAIKSISVSNFKSFSDIHIDLGKFNLLIGANASGKSNFVQIFKFLRDINIYGLENAISLQGGIEFLRNTNISSSNSLSLKVVFDQPFIRRFVKNGQEIPLKIEKTTYEFSLQFNKKGLGYRIIEDKLSQQCKFVNLENRHNKPVETETIATGEMIISKKETAIIFYSDSTLPIVQDDIFPPIFSTKDIPKKKLLLETPFFFFLFPPFPPYSNFFNDIAIYDFDPKLPKQSTFITGKTELEDDASNLAIVIKSILENDFNKRKFSNLLKELMPFIDDINVEKLTDKSLIFKLKELYYQKSQYIPAFLISDGTVNLTALIVALYFEDEPLAIIEEPERNIHPYLIARVVAMMKEASQEKQIITTTHNPQMVKYAELEDILLIARNKEGFSTISRPGKKDEIKIFLNNEIGLEELYVQNLLGAE
ncbi:MAG TPA: AAA family ATPase [Oculatellaceae cyanobacterium]|jgi:predicted ATPase